MFAVLGDFRFELLRAPEMADLTTEHEYATHKVIEGKPKVQWVGDELHKRTWDIRLHRVFCDPDAVMRAIRAAAAEHKAYPLSLGSGEYLGRYTINSIHEVTNVADDIGATVAQTATLALQEWTGQEATATGEAVTSAGVAPFGAVTSATLATSGLPAKLTDATLASVLRRPS